MGGYGSGGHNRTHNCVEKYNKLDSFYYRNFINFINSKRSDFLHLGKFTLYRYPLDREYRYYVENPEGTLVFENVPNNYGGMDRFYFECPYCYRRARYLYFCRHEKWYMCRTCAKLNYNSQQKTESRKLMLHKVRKFIQDKFEIFEEVTPDDAFCYQPERPKGMHTKTYLRLTDELQKLQDEYWRRYSEEESRLRSSAISLLSKYSNLDF